MLDKTFDAYQTYDWGVAPGVLKPIDEAIISSRGDAAARKDLETRIAAVLASTAPRAAKDYACRQLRTIGTAASVPALAVLLLDEELSHMARYALERLPAPAAGKALRDALAKTKGKLKVGLISSLGVRDEADSVAPLQSLLADPDESVARAAALALGAIASPEANQALVSTKPGSATKDAVADASLSCAEQLVAANKMSEAKATYERLLKSNPSGPVKLAAELGLKTCGGT